MPSRNELVPRRGSPGLLAKPQLLGIVPTWSYWNSPSWSPRIRLSFLICGGIAGLTIYGLGAATGLPIAAVYALIVLSGFLFFGLVERRVRATLAASREQKALPEQPERR